MHVFIVAIWSTACTSMCLVVFIMLPQLFLWYLIMSFCTGRCCSNFHENLNFVIVVPISCVFCTGGDRKSVV